MEAGQLLAERNHANGRQGKVEAGTHDPDDLRPEVREILTRRKYGMTEGPNPQQFKFGPEHYVFGDEAGQQIKSINGAWVNTVLKAHGVKLERTRRGGSLTADCLRRWLIST